MIARALLLAPILLLLDGCASLRPAVRQNATNPPSVIEVERRISSGVSSDEECARLDSAHRTWAGIAAGAGVLAGAGALADGIDPSDKDRRLAIGAVALTGAAVAAVAVYETNAYAATYARRCGGEHLLDLK